MSKRNRIHFYRKDFGVVNGYKKSISRKEASDYFIKYPNLNIIHTHSGYYERKHEKKETNA